MQDEERKLVLGRVKESLKDEDSAAVGAALEGLRESEIAEIVELVDNEDRRMIFDVLDVSVAAEVLEKIDEATRAEVFDILEDGEVKELFGELDSDDAADILAELSEEESEEILKSLEPEEAAEVKELMQYEEDSAGGIMDPVLIEVAQTATVAEAVNKIRAAEIDEDFFSVFVVDGDGRFVGDVRIRELLTSHEDTKISELIDDDDIYVNVNADQEEVRNLFSKNDLIVAPVLDDEKKLVGRITADRVIEVAEEEAAEDVYVMAGTDADELDTESVFRAARIRMTWLLPCLIGTAVTALVIIFFREMFNPVIFTAAIAFVPMIAAISGNAGLQTSAIVVCGLATGHLAALKVGQVFVREVRVAALVAVSCGIIGGLVCGLLLNPDELGGAAEPVRIIFAFGAAMFSAIMVATTLGLFLPFVFRKIGIDPAISSGPLVTTANDSISVAIYMALVLLLAA